MFQIKGPRLPSKKMQLQSEYRAVIGNHIFYDEAPDRLACLCNVIKKSRKKDASNRDH